MSAQSASLLEISHHLDSLVIRWVDELVVRICEFSEDDVVIRDGHVLGVDSECAEFSEWGVEGSLFEVEGALHLPLLGLVSAGVQYGDGVVHRSELADCVVTNAIQVH